jgi:uncharacterized protein YbjT (DUF2867 family)
MITIMGATGHTGKAIAEKLIAAGEKVRVLGRSADTLKPLVDRGADPAVGDANDPAYLTRAFRGSDVVYTLIPPLMTAPDFRAYQDKLGGSTAQAIKDSGVSHVAFLSSLGGDLHEGTGPIAGLHAQEKRLRETGANVLILRPTYFMENHFATLGMIKHQGINGGALAPDVAFPQVATRDIADVATELLRKHDWKGFTVRELLGPRDVSMREATSIIGGRIGKPDLQYIQFPYEDFAKSLTGLGISADLAGQYAEMSRAFNEGRIRSLEGRSAKNSTPTTLEAFADILAGAYAAA